MSLLEVQDLSVNFRVEGGTLEAVRQVSFRIDKGETVSLVGESGSGKSVTALSILQLLPYPKAWHPGGSVRMCITKAQAERDELPQEGNCKQQLVQRSGNTMKVKFNCTGDPPSSGETEVTFSSPMAYTGRSIVNMMIDGKPDRMTMEQSGKWLSDDCGNVKPRRN